MAEVARSLGSRGVVVGCDREPMGHVYDMRCTMYDVRYANAVSGRPLCEHRHLRRALSSWRT